MIETMDRGYYLLVCAVSFCLGYVTSFIACIPKMREAGTLDPDTPAADQPPPPGGETYRAACGAGATHATHSSPDGEADA
jgi:hypothetical protein